MIRCNHCKRLYKEGTLYCGSCGGSLGCRICPHRHESPLSARFCTTCGSQKLSDGVPATHIRPWFRLFLIIFAIAGAFAVVPLLVSASISNVPKQVPFEGVLQLGFVITLSMFVLGGNKGRKSVVRFYSGMLKLAFKFVTSLASSLIPSGHDSHKH